MSDIVKFSPAAGGVGFAQGAAEMAKRKPSTVGGVALLILQKADGVWVHGADRIEVEAGSRWVIDANATCQGFVAWHAGRPTEVMAFAGQPQIDPRDLPETQAKKGWEEQVGFGLVCMSGEDEGERVMYKTNTMGGKEAWTRVFDAMVARVGQKLPHNPIVELRSTSYPHHEHGTIQKPIFDIVGWVGDDGAVQIEDDAEDDGEDADADTEAPTRRAGRGRGSRKAG